MAMPRRAPMPGPLPRSSIRRQHYLRGRPLCHLLRPDRGEPGRRAAPHAHPADPGVVWGGLRWRGILAVMRGRGRAQGAGRGGAECRGPGGLGPGRCRRVRKRGRNSRKGGPGGAGSPSGTAVTRPWPSGSASWLQLARPVTTGSGWCLLRHRGRRGRRSGGAEHFLPRPCPAPKLVPPRLRRGGAGGSPGEPEHS